MNLFHEDGHLTQEGLAAITEGTLDEMQSLEAAEHLSFCDACLLRYTALLEADDDALLTPQQPLREPVLRRIHRRTVRLLFNKYTTVAAAALLMVVLWGSGVFTAPLQPHTAPDAPAQSTLSAPAQEEQRPPLADRLNHAAAQVSGGINGFFSNLFSSQPAEADAQQERDEREKLIDENKKGPADEDADGQGSQPATPGANSSPAHSQPTNQQGDE